VRRFVLPDLGEGLTESELVSWRVAVGDRVELNQVIAEVETAKALVELPSPTAGFVSRLYAEPGATVLVGEPLIDFDTGDGGGGDAGDAPRVEAAQDPANRVPSAERESVLVGYGPRVESGARPRRRERAVADAVGSLAQTSIGALASTPIAETAPAAAVEASPVSRPRSTPPVRRLARDLGVDLVGLVGTGAGGRISREDVEAVAGDAAADTSAGSTAMATPTGRGTTPPVFGVASDVASPTDGVPPAADDGTVRRPITGVRRRTAAAMVSSAFTAPHVTEFLTVDVTPTMTLIDALAGSPRSGDHRVNILTVLSKAVCIAVKRTPSVNARWDDDAQEIIEFGHVNLGLAAATPRGLLVPNIAGADRLSLFELADATRSLVLDAREGRTTPAALTGGTITITNIGVFGVDAGTPILNPGEAAIIALGAVRRQPWEFEGGIALRHVVTLALSFDHRVVDGEQGSRFLVDVGTMLADPAMVLTMV
jgi:2-oxoisovalerate dehydrogenase E2 component (dihydrolipoyl transacylase)